MHSCGMVRRGAADARTVAAGRARVSPENRERMVGVVCSMLGGTSVAYFQRVKLRGC